MKLLHVYLDLRYKNIVFTILSNCVLPFSLLQNLFILGARKTEKIEELSLHMMNLEYALTTDACLQEIFLFSISYFAKSKKVLLPT